MLCLNHKVSKFTASHNSNLSHDWNDIHVIIDRRPLRDFVARAPTSRSACGGKIIPYNPATGHRIKDDHFPPVMWVHTKLKATHLLPPEWSLTQCLFGERLLHDKVNANVALVESEKTAVICSLLLPEYIWLATGGKSQFNDRLMVLKGRKVTAFPGIDGYDEWIQDTDDNVVATHCCQYLHYHYITRQSSCGMRRSFRII